MLLRPIATTISNAGRAERDGKLLACNDDAHLCMTSGRRE